MIKLCYPKVQLVTQLFNYDKLVLEPYTTLFIVTKIVYIKSKDFFGLTWIGLDHVEKYKTLTWPKFKSGPIFEPNPFHRP